MKGQLITRSEPEQDITVLAGTTQFLKVETLRNIHTIHLNLTTAGGAATLASMLTDIAAVRLFIAGQPIVDLTPAEISVIWHYYNDQNGVNAIVGDLPLYFMPAEMPWNGQSKPFRLGMKANDDPNSTLANSMRLEVQWLAPGGGLTITRCQPFLETDDDDPESIGDHIRWKRFNTTWPAASVQDITTFDRERNAVLARAYWFPTAVGTISRFSVIEDSTFRMRDVPMTLLNQQEVRAGRTPQAGYQVLPLNLGNDVSSATPINALTKWTVSPTWSVLPGGYTVLQELIYRGL